MIRTCLSVLLIVLFLLLSCTPDTSSKITFNEENSPVPLTENMLYNRCIVWRPGDNTTVELNPPRFSWPYEPTIMLEEAPKETGLPIRTYRFQIAADEHFAEILFDVETTPFNFYNAVPVLPAGKKAFWRVGYYDPKDEGRLEWNKTRSFIVSADAVEWDRLALDKPRFSSAEHPRIIYTDENIEGLRDLARSNPHSKAIYQQVVKVADETLLTDWFERFPPTDMTPRAELCEIYEDIPEVREPYLMIIDRLMQVAFAYMLTGDDKYLPVVNRLVTVASYGPTGITRPEGMKGVGSPARPDNVEINEFLALFYDWFYKKMTPQQRETVLESLRWRTEHIMYSYSWRSRKGSRVMPSSVAVAGPATLMRT